MQPVSGACSPITSEDHMATLLSRKDWTQQVHKSVCVGCTRGEESAPRCEAGLQNRAVASEWGDV